eukprot:14766351-Alexandrium_andersonii.AAC.1
MLRGCISPPGLCSHISPRPRPVHPELLNLRASLDALGVTLRAGSDDLKGAGERARGANQEPCLLYTSPSPRD